MSSRALLALVYECWSATPVAAQVSLSTSTTRGTCSASSPADGCAWPAAIDRMSDAPVGGGAAVEVELLLPAPQHDIVQSATATARCMVQAGGLKALVVSAVSQSVSQSVRQAVAPAGVHGRGGDGVIEAVGQRQHQQEVDQADHTQR